MYNEIDIKNMKSTVSSLFDSFPIRVEVLLEDSLESGCPVLQKVIKTGMDLFVKSRKEHICKRCPLKEYLNSGSFIVKAIIKNQTVVGVILAGDASRQDEWFLNNYDQFNEKLDFCREWISNKLENEELRKQNDALLAEVNAVFSYTQEPVIIVDFDGTIQNASNGVSIEFNTARSVLMGENITEIISPNDWLQMKQSKKQQEWNINCQKSNGKRREYTAALKPIQSNGSTGSFLIHLTPYVETKKKSREQRVLYTFHDVIGTSESIQNVVDIAKRIAPSDTTVLVRGESGTGKEVFAQAIHQASIRKEGPFIAINCAAIPEALLESELFGHVKGAFTGATNGKAGRFELADGGTIFLDEIGDLPFPLQAKLLRVVQERKIERVGDTKSTFVNVRIITATHRNLENLVTRGDFREDLYYRLNVIPILIPPLRERKEDIPILIDFFLKKFSKDLFRSPKRISEQVMDKLLSYNWPGNIRELQNVVHHVVQLEIGGLVTIESLPNYLKVSGDKRNLAEREQSITLNLDKLKDEKEIIIELLDKYGRDKLGKKKVADLLKMSVPTLYRRIAKYKINR